MKIDTAFLLLTIVTLIINYATMFLSLPRRYGRLVSVGVPILFSVTVHVILYLTGTQSSFYRFWGGFIHLPLYFALSKGDPFKKAFVVLFVMVCTGFQLALASAVAGIFTQVDSMEFWMIVFILGLVMYSVYIVLVRLFARRFFRRLFISGSRREWALYSFGAAFSYIAMVVAITVSSGAERIVLLLFAFWSFCILCFAIINTHEKAMKSAEAEFASGIISSGRGHYQKMDGLQEKLRILRHDYKYHLSAIGELAAVGDNEGIGRYLSVMQAQLSENEIRDYCTNNVVNALLSSYAERCAKSGVKFDVVMSMPQRLTIPDYDLCIILGNLLENAMEACEQLAEGMFIELLLKPLGEQLALMVRNSFNGMVINGGGRPVSKKKDGGLGLKSIEVVTARYDGELTTEWDGDTFTAGVTVRL